MRSLFDGLRSAFYAAVFILFWAWLGLEVRAFDSGIPVRLPSGSRAAGVVFMAAGGILALACVALFATRGRGTPALFDPPQRFVAVGPYRWVRNPMYLGAGTLFLGFGLWHRSPSILLLGGFAWALIHLLVLFVEEPGLKRRFGESYQTYLESVPRWLPRRPATSPTEAAEGEPDRFDRTGRGEWADSDTGALNE